MFDTALRFRSFWPETILVVLVLTVFSQVGGHGWIAFDTMAYVSGNARVQQGLSWDNFFWAFRTMETGDWQPLTWLSFMLDCHLFGVSPAANHLVNLFLHLLNVLLLYKFLLGLTGARWKSFFVAAFFSIHPLRAESVVWVAERKDVLSGLFWMLACRFYLVYARRPSLKKMAVTAACMALGLMSKPVLMTLPFVFLLLDFWPLGRWQSGLVFRLWMEKLPLFIMATASALVSVQAVAHANVLAMFLPFSMLLSNAAVSYVKYLGKTFWPVDLIYFYSHPLDKISVPLLFASIAILAGLAALCWIWRRKHPYFTMGMAWFFGVLLPMSGVVQAGDQGMADRYTYLPHIGLFIALVWMIEAWTAFNPGRRQTAAATGILCLMLLVPISWKQVSYWKNSITLNEYTLAVEPDNYMAHQNLAFALASRGDYEGAEKHFLRSIKAAPGNRMALFNLADIYMRIGDREEAKKYLHLALKVKSDSARVLTNLGVLSALEGNFEQAGEYYRKVLQINSRYLPARKGWADLLLKTGHVDEAVAALEQLHSDYPADADLVMMLGFVAVKLNRHEDAIRYFSKWRDLMPLEPRAHNSLGNAQYYSGQLEESERSYREAIRLRPGFALAHRNLGRVLRKQKRWKEAEAVLRRAIELAPNLAQAYLSMGRLLYSQGQASESLAYYRRALEISPVLAPAYARMADSLRVLGRLDEAEAYTRKAQELRSGFLLEPGEGLRLPGLMGSAPLIPPSSRQVTSS